MSWQGNECFVFGIDYVSENCEEQMIENMSELLHLYQEHGNGWYLLGNMDESWSTEDDYDEQPNWERGWDFAWLPNPFMMPALLAMKICRPHDLLEAAFECWDCGYYTIAYAGDGEEPLEHVVIRGKEYDMR